MEPRRRRVFVIGAIDNRTDLTGKVLFEQKAMCLHSQKKPRPQQEITGTLTKNIGSSGWEFDFFASGGHAIEYYKQSSFGDYRSGVGTLTKNGGNFGGGDETIVLVGDRVRKLTPLECECLQGFPDNFTQIEWRGKPKEDSPDGHRYKAIGNSMAIPVVKWLGERLLKVLVSDY